MTARQTLVLGVAGLVLYGAYQVAHRYLPMPVLVALSLPMLGGAVVLAMGRRDGLPLDRFLFAAFRQHREPKQLVPAPEGVPQLPGVLSPNLARKAGPVPAVLRTPIRGIDAADDAGSSTGGEVGVADLGPDGWAVLIACSTVNFGLRTGTEQQALIGAFARVLNAAPAVQILLRATSWNLQPAVEHTAAAARDLPHPALRAAAADHAAFLEDLHRHSGLLARQVLLIIREPATAAGRAGREQAITRLVRHAHDTARALAACEVTAHVLTPDQVAAAIADTTSPTLPTALGGHACR